jgi:hypothetical protein
VDFDTPNARNASGRGGRAAAFKFYEIPDNLLIRVSPARQVDFVELAFGDVTLAACA